MPTVSWFITGTNRGIGLGIVQHLSTDPDNIIFATCRDPTKAEKLSSLATGCKAKIHPVKLDTKDERSIQTAAEEIKALLGERRLDYLINNAAAQSSNANALSIESIPFTEDMKSNVLGPALIAKAFLPALEKSGESDRPPIVMNTSSGLGSIGLQCGPKEAIYSISKVALNMLTYKQAAEKPNIIWICLDPGWVKTDMGGPDAHLSVDESVQGILKVLSSVTSKDSGSFKHYTGKDIPW